jgi:hypothetical protein
MGGTRIGLTPGSWNVIVGNGTRWNVRSWRGNEWWRLNDNVRRVTEARDEVRRHTTRMARHGQRRTVDGYKTSIVVKFRERSAQKDGGMRADSEIKRMPPRSTAHKTAA